MVDTDIVCVDSSRYVLCKNQTYPLIKSSVIGMMIFPLDSLSLVQTRPASALNGLTFIDDRSYGRGRNGGGRIRH